MQSFFIDHPSDADQRLDKFIKKYLPNAPLGAIYKMLRTGKIKVNAKKKEQTYKLEMGDEISIWLSDEEIRGFATEITESKIPATQHPILEILYRDDALIVVNKPPKMTVHPWDHKTTEVSLIEIVQDMLGDAYDSLTFKPALLHRLDRDTSGCIIIVLEKSALETLLKDLQDHKIEKMYHAIALGIPAVPEGTIRDKILRVDHATNEAKVRVDPSGQSAVTHFRVLDEGTLPDADSDHVSLLECHIETGRTHQIRVHLSYHNCPIIGDKAYGEKKINSYVRRQYGVDRQMLHARALTFVHPKTKKRIHIEAPYPADFSRVLEVAF